MADTLMDHDDGKRIFANLSDLNRVLSDPVQVAKLNADRAARRARYEATYGVTLPPVKPIEVEPRETATPDDVVARLRAAWPTATPDHDHDAFPSGVLIGDDDGWWVTRERTVGELEYVELLGPFSSRDAAIDAVIGIGTEGPSDA